MGSWPSYSLDMVRIVLSLAVVGVKCFPGNFLIVCREKHTMKIGDEIETLMMSLIQY